jgi:hypothetical protein
MNPENIWNGKNAKLPENFIKEILTTHNTYRSTIAQGNVDSVSGKLPSATNMVQIYWDEKLSRKAQLWANNCEPHHSGEQFRALSGKHIGENIFLKTSAGEIKPELMDWEGAIKIWFEQAKFFNKKDIYPFQTQPASESFSQLSWAKSQYVGCGYATYKSPNGDTNQYYVCHYSPGGNTIIKEMYNEGDSCSKCPNGYECKSEYKGLCCMTNFCSKTSLEIKKRLLKQ